MRQTCLFIIARFRVVIQSCDSKIIYRHSDNLCGKLNCYDVRFKIENLWLLELHEIRIGYAVRQELNLRPPTPISEKTPLLFWWCLIRRILLAKIGSQHPMKPDAVNAEWVLLHINGSRYTDHSVEPLHLGRVFAILSTLWLVSSWSPRTLLPLESPRNIASLSIRIFIS